MATRPRIAPSYQQRRKIRRPVHTFNLRTQAWQLQPFLLAPVLPGETMRSAMVQARVVSDPINNPLIGWWHENYLFYVKHRDIEAYLSERGGDAVTVFQNMMLDPNADMSSVTEAAAAPSYYHAAGSGINFAKLALAKVVEDHFRNEGEAWDDFLIDGMPVSSVNRESFFNSVVSASQYHEVDVPVDADGDGTINASEVDESLRTWQLMRMHNLTDMSYEDYLATYGVRRARTEVHVSEILRWSRDWTYPTNTIDPTDGSPSSAVSWVVQERADKDRFFSEPGFILGVACTRPKVYFRAQRGSAAHGMTDALAWLPAVLHDDKRTSLRHFAEGDGPLSSADPEGYVVDMRDLLVYGDQFINYDPASVTDANLVDLPTDQFQRYYASQADANALFSSAEKNVIKQDGIVSFMIAGRQEDTTPGTPAAYQIPSP